MNSKVALCLYGFYNNRSDGDAGNKGFKYIQNKIYNECEKHEADLDVFFHSWDEELEKKLVNQYEPKSYQFEKSHDFNEIAVKQGINENSINSGFNRKDTIYKQCTVNTSLSFLYSRSNSLQKALDYSKNSIFEYDVIIAARFDLGQRSNWHKNYNVSLMEFDLNLDMNYIYSAMWMQLNAGIADQWFFSNQKNMELLGKMYEMTLNNYLKSNSDYEKAITSGWIDSNENSHFTNEVLKKNKTDKLIKYPKWQMINNHLLHKWHLINTNIYNKSKYIGNVKI